jgi:uncharacterized DUF497 family protein
MSGHENPQIGYEWDDNKETQNILKHGIDFESATLIWESMTISEIDGRFDYGEERFFTIGEVDGRTIVVVFTWRRGIRRIISARKASRDERRKYHETCARGEADPPP